MNDLPKLPDISYLDTDPSQIINDILNGYEAVVSRQLADADPVRLFLLTLAYRIIQERLRTEQRLMQQLLYYAVGSALDHLGTFRELPRNEATGAKTTLEFEISAPQVGAVVIAKGKRVTADNILYFATTETAEIPAGQLTVQVPAEALTTGAAGNDIAVGQISTIVDPFPFQKSVKNITTTQGGADTESDDSYRERIYFAPATFSIAGPRDAYKYLAKSVSTEIMDVSATSPSPTVVEIRPLMNGGELPTQSILDLIEEKLSAETVRPLTDQVIVKAPDVVNYSLNLTYYIGRSNQAKTTEIQTAVNTAIADYILWQRSVMGRDINPDELISRIKAAGAKRAVITSPVFTVTQPGDVAVCNSQTVTYGGVEDE